MSCPICIDTFTSVVRKEVKCPYCEYTACVGCVKRYLTEGTSQAHCMSCRRGWNDEFLDLNFTKAFRTGPWKKHMEKLLWEREMAILPTRQTRVEAKYKFREASKEIQIVHKKLAEHDRERARILHELNHASRKQTRYAYEARGDVPPAYTLDESDKAVSSERAKFIMKCPDGDCRGFLSTQYKCGTCQKWVCPDCLEIKGLEKEVEHTCSEERKASMELILKESKPCPKCGNRISKVSGCDQMWCPDCHTAFSWQTGQMVNGVIHNPHYYEFLRKNGNGVAPRNAGDIPCGGVPYYHHFMGCLTHANTGQRNMATAIHRIAAEVNDQRLAGYQGQFNQADNGDLAVMYLMKEISEADMKAELVKRETKRQKHLAIRAILEMFVNTSTMMLNHMVNHPPKSQKEMEKKLLEFHALKKYVNESLISVSKQKGCSVPQIGSSNENEGDWRWVQFAKYSPEKKVVKKEVKKESLAAGGGGGGEKEEGDSDVESLIEDILEATKETA